MARLELKLKREPWDTFQGIEGTAENIRELAKKLEVLGITGVLVGGCIDDSKHFPRKDIDIVLPECVGREGMEGYDIWLHFGDRTENVKNVNTYHSLGSLALALGNLPPGLHVLNDMRSDVRRNLPVTSYTSLADILKSNEGDILHRYIGRPVAFSFQGKHYVGRLTSSDMWFAQFDDVVELNLADLVDDIPRAYRNKDEKEKELERARSVLEQSFREELEQLDDVVVTYFRNYPDVETSHFIPYNIDKFIQDGRDQVFESLFWWIEETNPLFSIRGATDIDSRHRGGELKSIYIPCVDREIPLNPEIRSKRKDIKSKLLDCSFLSPDSPNFFRQYQEMAQRGLLSFFEGYKGNYSFAKQSMAKLTNSPPLLG